MACLDIDGMRVELDAEGYLIQPAYWNPQIAERLAKNEGAAA